MQKLDTRTSQGSILILQDYWARQDCTIIQSLDMKAGAETPHPIACLRALGLEPMAATYAQSSRRLTDDHYGENPNRLQHYYQFQAVAKPSPSNIRELYLGSLEELGIDSAIHDVRFVGDNWENPTLGAWRLGWEVWLNGMGMTQFVYFQQVGGLECKPITGRTTYGLERLAMYIQGVDSAYDPVWSDDPLGKTTYGDVLHQNEVEQFTYNFECANVDFLLTCFEQYEKKAQQLLAPESPLPLPAYERILKATHNFNLLDTRKIISVAERQYYILRIRTLTRVVAETYYASRETLGFPMCNKDK